MQGRCFSGNFLFTHLLLTVEMGSDSLENYVMRDMEMDYMDVLMAALESWQGLIAQEGH